MSHKGSNNEQDDGRNILIHPPYLCFFRIWKLYRNNLNLPCFSIKKIKELRDRVLYITLPLLFKNTRLNSEVQKLMTLETYKTDPNPPITNH